MEKLNLSFLENKWVSGVIAILIVLYGSLVAPELPPKIKNMFKNPIVRIIIMTLIVWRGNKNPTLALMIAVGFLLTMNYVSESEVKEHFGQQNGNDQIHF